MRNTLEMIAENKLIRGHSAQERAFKQLHKEIADYDTNNTAYNPNHLIQSYEAQYIHLPAADRKIAEMKMRAMKAWKKETYQPQQAQQHQPVQQPTAEHPLNRFSWSRYIDNLPLDNSR